MLLMVLLGIVRLLFPIDLDKALVIRSYQVIPAVEDFLEHSVVGSLSVASLLLGIWAVGTLAFLIRDSIRQLRFVRVSRHYPAVDRMDLIDLAGELDGSFALLVSPAISRPYVSGLFRPVIYLPDIDLPEEQWRIILRHEVQHIRSHDEWKKLFFLAIQALFWWNPLAHMSLAEIDTLIELQCDAKATAGMSPEEVDRYLETLKSLKTQSPSHGIPASASALVWDQKQLVARFAALQDAGFSHKPHPRAVAYILLFGFFVMSYYVIVQPARYPNETGFWDNSGNSDEDTLLPYSLEISDGYIVHADGEYLFYINDRFMSRISEEQLSEELFKSMPIVEKTNETLSQYASCAYDGSVHFFRCLRGWA